MRKVWRWRKIVAFRWFVQFPMSTVKAKWCTDLHLCKIPDKCFLILCTTVFCISCFCLLLSLCNPTLKCPCMAAQLQWTLLSLCHNFWNSKPQVHDTGNMSFYQINTLLHGAGGGRSMFISIQTMYGLFNVIKIKTWVIKTLLNIFSEVIFYASILLICRLNVFLTDCVETHRSNKKCRIWHVSKQNKDKSEASCELQLSKWRSFG